MRAAAVRMDSSSSSVVVAPSLRPEMVRVATHIGSMLHGAHDLVDVDGLQVAVALADPHGRARRVHGAGRWPDGVRRRSHQLRCPTRRLICHLSCHRTSIPLQGVGPGKLHG
jgi:hypothetical protein